ncbi:hypothetical protein CAPTEDRAFT_221099 [Capitella teleta]|uniref:Protein FAM177A1 n=1 Tax=Capitella teleta TaxID=283909 RepID=R7VCF9_CAPTE|nr:hypothetical protein CAPTEDRAFT_221099 [Capitella teleta]|eukprot:ELU16309.1 hypothetical protein CAPTEDRAFT_221099 [Capitella teleta]
MESSASNNIPQNSSYVQSDALAKGSLMEPCNAHLCVKAKGTHGAANPDEFTDLSLEMVEAAQEKKTRVPRRILHFSDGILEEYSTEEEESEDEMDAINPSTLSWFPWLRHQFGSLAYSTFSAADVCGEKLAWFFGITSPKYQYAIDEYNRMRKEEEEEKQRDEREKEAERRRMGDCLSGVESALPAELTNKGVDNEGYSHDKF